MYTCFFLQVGGLLNPPMQIYIPQNCRDRVPIHVGQHIYENVPNAYPIRLCLVGRVYAEAYGEEPMLLTTGQVAASLGNLAAPTSWTCTAVIETCQSVLSSTATGVSKEYGVLRAMAPPKLPAKKKDLAEVDVADQIELDFMKSLGKGQAAARAKLFVGVEESSEDDAYTEAERLMQTLLRAELRALKGKAPFKKARPDDSGSSDSDSSDQPWKAKPKPPDIFPPPGPPPPPPPLDPPPDAGAVSDGAASSNGSRAAKVPRTDFAFLKAVLGDRWLARCLISLHIHIAYTYTCLI